MATGTKELYETMKASWDEFEANHNEYIAKSKKSCAGRARKSLNLLRKNVTNYRQASTAEVKAMKEMKKA